MTVTICSIVGIGVFSYFVYPIQPEEITTVQPITYSLTSQNTQTQQNLQTNNDSQFSDTIINIDSLEQQIHTQINNIREQSGLKPLKLDTNIVNMATAHSKDMLIKNYFDHTSPDGKTLLNRLYDAKIPCGFPGENIEQTSTSDTPNTIIQSWMDSSEHKNNILSKYYSSEGIGISINGDIVMITEDFC